MSDSNTAVAEHTQHDIELPNGVVVSGVGGDVDALRESFESRHEERTGTSASDAGAPATAASEPAEDTDRPMSRATQRVKQAVDRAKAAEEAKAATERQIQELKEQIAQMQRSQQAPPATPTTPTAVPVPSPTATTPRPTPEQFADYDQYYEALADWKAEQRFQKLANDLLQKTDAQTQARIEGERAAREFAHHTQSIFERGQETYPDFDAVIQSSTTPLPPLQLQTLMAVPNPEKVMYALAKNPAQFEAFCALQNEFQIGMFLGQLGSSTSGAVSAASSPMRATTKAPAPPQPLGSSTPSTGPSLEELAEAGNYEAYKAKRRAQLAR